MAVLDARSDAVVIRIVYDGAPMAGKTTSVGALGRGLGSNVLTPAEVGGRTLYFDWLDYTGGLFEGHRIRCQEFDGGRAVAQVGMRGKGRGHRLPLGVLVIAEPVDPLVAGGAAVVTGHLLEVIVDRQLGEADLLDLGRRHQVEEIEDGADAHIDSLAKKYLGVDTYPMRKPDEVRVKYRVHADHVVMQPADAA